MMALPVFKAVISPFSFTYTVDSSELSQRPSYLYDSLEILARRCCAYYAREHRRYAQEASE